MGLIRNAKESDFCSICGRDTPSRFQEHHHLIPKCKKGKETILVCCSCGDMIHKIFTIKELEKVYNTLESILSKEEVIKWVRWIRNKNDFNITMKAKKRRK